MLAAANGVVITVTRLPVTVVACTFVDEYAAVDWPFTFDSYKRSTGRLVETVVPLAVTVTVGLLDKKLEVDWPFTVDSFTSEVTLLLAVVPPAVGV